ncbi:class A beta-lactamase-related serine hydrolase [Aureibaculum marinum]|uniref:Class A beta-lactamase-related serine hydrolase n=1 Tax=Aureibaculum marinum TaxID=2487930 RepID=A0A3N4NAR5_9FLAO|nr:serine hydrolase domain-containing protein [Aureibaculum marinum]RPD93251.1 class A beta-lactamase-related serine hydrolase [Aureibaculum marinum]
MKYLSLVFALVIYNFCSGQILDTPPPSNYQKEVDSVNAKAFRFMLKEKIPGMAISISRHGELFFSKGFGVSNLKLNRAVSAENTLFRIASISKSITALAMAKLVDKGKLNFEESIYTYLPKYPKKKYDFTVKQVAGHIAGIRHYIGGEFILNKKISITEGLEIFKNDSLKFEPGTGYSYSTYGWNLLSEVVQKLTKQPFDVFVKSSIFEPLKMKNSLLEYSDSILPNKTEFYRKTNDGTIVIGPEVNNEFKAAGGGFLSTSNDLILFGNEIINPTIINKSTVTKLVTSLKTNDGKDTGYGIGFVTNKSKNNTPRYSHSGGGIGATTLLLMYPEENLVIVILTNLSNVKIKDFGNELEGIFLN